MNRYKISRRGQKLQSDSNRVLLALPKDISERSWADIFQREETELMILDIREEIIEMAMDICYAAYMERQKALFTTHCAAQAWLKLINWNYFRHDPGEDPSAYPPCYIPKRKESWIPDDLPTPSPKDSWCRQDLEVVDEVVEEKPRRWSSASSLEMASVEDIPKEYWFTYKIRGDGSESGELDEESSSSEKIGVDSEVLQKIIDYSNSNINNKEKHPTAPVPGSVSPHQGAGDRVSKVQPKRRTTDKSKLHSTGTLGRSKPVLPPIAPQRGSSTNIGIVPDCRLKSLRMNTQYEISSEKIDSPRGELKRK